MSLGKLKPEAELQWRASAILEGLENFDPKTKFKDDERTPLGWLLGHLLDIRRVARAEIRAELGIVVREESNEKYKFFVASNENGVWVTGFPGGSLEVLSGLTDEAEWVCAALNAYAKRKEGAD